MVDDKRECPNAQPGEVPVVKPKHAGGRHPKGWYEADVQEVLNGGARRAVRILNAHMDQSAGNRKIKDSVLKICFFVIDHAIGKAKQKVEHSGGILTYKGIVQSIDKPREVLAEVEEIASKYQEKTAVKPVPGADKETSEQA